MAAAIIAPSALSIVTTIFRDGAARNKALRAWGAVSGGAGAAGVLLGGVLTDGLGWQWVLWVNVPIGVAVAVLTPRWIPESRMEASTRRFDIPGAVTGTGGLALIVYAIVNAGEAGWGSVETMGLLAAAVVLLGTFVAIEGRSMAPLVPFRILGNRSLTGANVAGLLVGGSVVSMFFFVTLYMQQVLGYSPIEAGLAYLPLTAMIILCSGVASQLVTRFGARSIFVIGLGLVVVALLWFSRVAVDGGYATDVLGPSLVAGAGFGLAFVPMTIAAVSGVQEQESGLASGLINTSQQIGGALGLAVLAAIATSRTDSLLASNNDDPAALADALNAGFQNAFVGGAVVAAVGAVLALAIIPSRDNVRTILSVEPQPADELNRL
ncbi:MFS transporter [Phytoactinopolyspora halotolerans]|uniref:MFS transporter n=1 Tax=Phytoactinopolyspora halotolerans TaxID=1981512 RepID=A0A6L9SG13_9ACTN|nr:MFS transporter [Phytoactinopolyspora halotolerans]NEE04216.1 MFS transporter [Phytoactinopolyspora halotolerans]